MGGKAQRRKRARERGQPKEKVGKKERLVFFLFLMCVCLHDSEVLANSICPQQSPRRREKAFPYVQISIQPPLICAVVL